MEKYKAELTVKSILIGIFLGILLCGANVYLGLKIGNTISASIPASILAMGLLRMFKKYNVLENNISQTIASAGESIAVVVIFVFPALLILNVWKDFNYFNILGLAICGGLIGIIFSVALRKVLLNDKSLSFPEGQAIGQVLISTNDKSNKSGLKAVLFGMLFSGALNFCQVGLQIFATTYYKIINIGKVILGTGASFSVAIIGAGYLVGFSSAFASMIAVLSSWLILLPIFSFIHGIPDNNNLVDSAFEIWDKYIRSIGIGVMIFSGFSTIVILAKPIKNGIAESLKALKSLADISESDRDLNMKKLGILLIVLCIPVFIFIFNQLDMLTSFGLLVHLLISFVILLLVLVLGFVIAAISGYFAGFIGSTNSPLSGLMFIAVIALCLLFQVVVGSDIKHELAQVLTTIILLVAFISFAACITNETSQDFKSGQMVGASPYKQQISLFFGVIASALVVPIFINLIFNAYGIGGIIPHAGINPHETLSAPQATAIAALTKNIIHGSQDWSLIGIGMIVGAMVVFIDIIGKKSNSFRFPVLAVGYGIYLPPDLVCTLFLGGLLKLIITRKHAKIKAEKGDAHITKFANKTNLFICGLIAGESLMGLFLAVPFVIKQSSNALKIVTDSFLGISQILSALIILGLLLFTYRLSQKE